MVILLVTSITLSGCVWPFWWDDGGRYGGGHHGGGWHDEGRHGGHGGYGDRR